MRELEPLWSMLLVPHEEDGLVTLVAREGSGFRRPGARMLAAHSGENQGLVTAGCLEDELACWATELVAPELKVIDASAPSDAWFGTGTGCMGILTFLGEPLHLAMPSLTVARHAEDARVKCVIAVAVNPADGKPGTRGAVAGDGRETGDLPAGVLARARRLASESCPVPQRPLPIEEGWFFDVRDLVPRLVLVAHAFDYLPMRDIARGIGWDLVIADTSMGVELPMQGPLRHIDGRPSDFAENLMDPLDRRTSFVLMTHRFEKDLAFLQQAEVEKAGHVAIVGPPARTRRLLDELAETHPDRAAHLAKRLVSPAGIPLGGHGPGATALSVMAEAHRAIEG